MTLEIHKAKFSSPCNRCHCPVYKGDLVAKIMLPGRRVEWVHPNCAGPQHVDKAAIQRIVREIGTTPKARPVVLRIEPKLAPPLDPYGWEAIKAADAKRLVTIVPTPADCDLLASIGVLAFCGRLCKNTCQVLAGRRIVIMYGTPWTLGTVGWCWEGGAGSVQLIDVSEGLKKFLADGDAEAKRKKLVGLIRSQEK